MADHIFSTSTSAGDSLGGRTPVGYNWISLTAELRRADMPVRQWFSSRLFNAAPVYRQFRASIPRVRLLEPPSSVSTGTLGSAFEVGLWLNLDPAAEMTLAIDGAANLAMIAGNRAWNSIAEALVSEAHDAALASNGSSGIHVDELSARRFWALALLIEAGRGLPPERSPLNGVLERPSVEGLMNLMPPDGLQDLCDMLDRAEQILLPFIRSRSGQVILGPTFESPMPADADVLVGRSLIELKAMLGRRSRTGTPRWGLDARMLYQSVGYGLLGQAEYGIDELTIFNPRWGHQHTWNLDALLTELAGVPTRAGELAAEFVDFLGDPCGPNAPPSARQAAISEESQRRQLFVRT